MNRWLFLLIASMFLFTACQTQGALVEEEPDLTPASQEAIDFITKHEVTIEGTITQINADRMTVEEKPSIQEGKKGILSFDEKTQYLIVKDGKYFVGKKEDLKINQKIKVWVDGFFIQTYPFQARADYIVYELPK